MTRTDELRGKELRDALSQARRDMLDATPPPDYLRSLLLAAICQLAGLEYQVEYMKSSRT
jgi:hypothetical protein